MSKKKLGRGLESLLGAAPAPVSLDSENATGTKSELKEAPAVDGAVLRALPIEQLVRGAFQPRQHFDEEALEELAASIRSQGLMQPLVVRPLGAGFEIIAGERRWRAAQRAGLDRVPVLVRTLDDQSALALALIENVQREDLSPLEEAAALERLMTTFSLTQAQAAEAVGKQRATVANLLRLLRLGSEARPLLERGDLTMGHARALLALDDPRQGTLAREAVQRGWTVRETERQVQRALAPSKEGTASEATGPSRETRHLERSLSERLGAPVRIEHGKKGGRIVIRYGSLDELDGVLAHLR
ncbi:MAG: ParB/RepB/Spo0J family partition protein [Pseudomonadota bacterium]|nr:ParB/RepB/Spo0J family partition protein [Pseudomonadota bacterium]